MAGELPSAESLRHPKQPPLLYDVDAAWRSNVIEGPQWLGDYPPFPTEAKYSFLGRSLISPIEFAAGPAGGRKWTQFGLRMGYGIGNQKTMRSVPWEGNAASNIALVQSTTPLDESALPGSLRGSLDLKDTQNFENMGNSFGNPSFRMLVWAAEFREQLQDVRPGQVLVMSVTPTATEEIPLSGHLWGKDVDMLLELEAANDVVHAATAAAIAGAKMVEMNLSCRNVVEHPEEGEMFQNPAIVGYAVQKFKRMFPDVNIGIKGGSFNNRNQMARVFEACDGQLDFISLINTIQVRVEGEPGEVILPGRKTIGVSGPAINPIALRNVEDAAAVREKMGLKLGIKGGGGVSSPEDANRMLNAGADVVFVANQFLRNPLFAYEYRLYKAGLAA